MSRISTWAGNSILRHGKIPKRHGCSQRAFLLFQGTSQSCGNDMIAAHVETLVDSKLPTGLPQSLGKVFDFPTIIWITAKQLPTFPQDLRRLIFNMLRKTSDFESLFVDSKLPLWY